MKKWVMTTVILLILGFIYQQDVQAQVIWDNNEIVEGQSGIISFTEDFKLYKELANGASASMIAKKDTPYRVYDIEKYDGKVYYWMSDDYRVEATNLVDFKAIPMEIRASFYENPGYIMTNQDGFRLKSEISTERPETLIEYGTHIQHWNYVYTPEYDRQLLSFDKEYLLISKGFYDNISEAREHGRIPGSDIKVIPQKKLPKSNYMIKPGVVLHYAPLDNAKTKIILKKETKVNISWNHELDVNGYVKASIPDLSDYFYIPVNSLIKYGYPDVLARYEFYEAVTDLTERDIIKGFPDGSFKPYNSVTRGQAAKILAHILNLDIENVENPNFTDVDEADEYYGPIAALAEAGIISGYTDSDEKSFKPANTLTRSQMAKIIAKGFELKEEDLTDSPFTDIHEDDEFAGYVQSLFTHEITQGTTPTTFSPAAIVSRSQLALFVTRAEAAVIKQSDEELIDFAFDKIYNSTDWKFSVEGGEEATIDAKLTAIKTYIEEVVVGNEIEVTVHWLEWEEEGKYIITLAKGEVVVERDLKGVRFEVTAE